MWGSPSCTFFIAHRNLVALSLMHQLLTRRVKCRWRKITAELLLGVWSRVAYPICHLGVNYMFLTSGSKWDFFGLACFSGMCIKSSWLVTGVGLHVKIASSFQVCQNQISMVWCVVNVTTPELNISRWCNLHLKHIYTLLSQSVVVV